MPFIVKWLLLLALVAGCTKKSYLAAPKEITPVPEQAKLLTAFRWKEASVIRQRVSNGDTLENNVTSQFASIDRDDLTVFNADGTFLFEEGMTKFNLLSAQKYQKGTWKLDSSAQTLSLTFNHSTDHYTIMAIDSSRLIVRLPVSQNDSSYAYVITYAPEPRQMSRH